MRSITVLMLMLICVFGLVWIGSGVEDIGSSDIGDNVDQDQAEQVYSPITTITQLAVSGLPYIALLLVIIGALRLYVLN